MPSDHEIQRAIDDYARAVNRAMERQIITTFMPNPAAIAPMTVCDVPNNPLTLESLRRLMAAVGEMPVDFIDQGRFRTAYEQRLRQWQMDEQANRWHRQAFVFESRLPIKSVKYWAANSTHGVCILGPKGNVTFISMGVVKTCDEAITWDSQAMQAGPDYRKGPWRPKR